MNELQRIQRTFTKLFHRQSPPATASNTIPNKGLYIEAPFWAIYRKYGGPGLGPQEYIDTKFPSYRKEVKHQLHLTESEDTYTRVLHGQGLDADDFNRDLRNLWRTDDSLRCYRFPITLLGFDPDKDCPVIQVMKGWTLALDVGKPVLINVNSFGGDN